MIESVIFTSDADDDVATSYDWYENREPGLGEEFLRSIEAVLDAFSAIPRCIRSPSMSFGVRLFAAFLLRFSTSRDADVEEVTFAASWIDCELNRGRDRAHLSITA